jgi:hypothetical protein
MALMKKWNFGLSVPFVVNVFQSLRLRTMRISDVSDAAELDQIPRTASFARPASQRHYKRIVPGLQVRSSFTQRKNAVLRFFRP